MFKRKEKRIILEPHYWDTDKPKKYTALKVIAYIIGLLIIAVTVIYHSDDKNNNYTKEHTQYLNTQQNL